MAPTGIRNAKAELLLIADFDISCAVIQPRRAITKTNRDGVCPLPMGLARLLSQYLEHERTDRARRQREYLARIKGPDQLNNKTSVERYRLQIVDQFSFRVTANFANKVPIRDSTVMHNCIARGSKPSHAWVFEYRLQFFFRLPENLVVCIQRCRSPGWAPMRKTFAAGAATSWTGCRTGVITPAGCVPAHAATQQFKPPAASTTNHRLS